MSSFYAPEPTNGAREQKWRHIWVEAATQEQLIFVVGPAGMLENKLLTLILPEKSTWSPLIKVCVLSRMCF